MLNNHNGVKRDTIPCLLIRGIVFEGYFKATCVIDDWSVYCCEVVCHLSVSVFMILMSG